ncbi:MAG: hypothetical protein N4A61_02000 [Pelagimonas sp.]|jgi:hypothetical protein|nr:hypothetical protein [Pelagimonas sp.]
MTQSLTRRVALKSRALINLTNATILARLNGSTVVSGFPKTGTTYLSHVAQFATGRTYIEGSRRLALRPSVIHCHFRNVPASAVFSYRPINKVIASYTTHLLSYDPQGIFDRLAAGKEHDADLERITQTAMRVLKGTPRMPGPLAYYSDVLERGGVVIPIEALADPQSAAHRRLAAHWHLSDSDLAQGIEQAETLSQARKKQGNEFYNRPSQRIAALLNAKADLSARIQEQSQATQALLEGAGHV